MSFTLSDLKQKGKTFPLAKLKTRDKVKYIYYADDKKIDNNVINDILDESYPNLSSGQKENIINSVKTQTEPTDPKLERIYYFVLDKMKHNQAKYTVPSGKTLQVLPDFSRIEKLYICGISGAGKSTFSAEFVKQYLKHYKDNEFYILSTVDDDEPLDKLSPIRVDLNSMLEDPISIKDELHNSIVLFDDTSTISNTIVRKACTNLLDSCLEIGRHYNVTVINTSHIILDYKASRKMLNEATGVVIFCKVGSNIQNVKYLENYAGLDKFAIKKILNLPSRWVYIRRTPPQMVIFDKGCYLL
jgi:hypothetical protein